MGIGAFQIRCVVFEYAFIRRYSAYKAWLAGEKTENHNGFASLSLFYIKVYAEHGEYADGFLYFGGGLSVFKIGEIGDADVREPANSA